MLSEAVNRHTSVLWRLAWPSQRATFRMSPVAWKVCIAHECLML